MQELMTRAGMWVAQRRQGVSRPLVWLLLVGGALRLLAAFFSRGYLAVDDHHVLVVAADRLASGEGLPADYKRSFLYPLLVSLTMSGVRATGVASPDTEMLMVRLAHALYSLLAIALVFRILDRTAGQESALIGGALMATFYPMPVTSVHQLEEVVCQVPLLAGCYLLLRESDVDQSRAALSGVVTGLALILRFQLLSFVLPLLLLVWYGRRSRVALWWTVGLLLVLGLQGASNAVVNGEWWFSFKRYYGTLLGAPDELVLGSNGYPSGPIWRYVLTVLGAFVPPFSLVAVAAMIIGGRKLWCLGLPTLVFFVAHSLIANKQERFLLPILPMLVLLAAAGGPVVRRWFVRRGWGGMYGALWAYFGLVNLALLLVTVFSYGKKDRVAPLVTIQRRGDATGVVVAQYNQTFSVPVYYLGKTRPPVVRLKGADSLVQEQVMRMADGRLNYAILYSDSIQSDSASLARLLARPLARVATIRPSLTDRLAHWVNPRHNKAKIAIVYAVRQ